jgi:hypothetical protein
MEYQTTETYLSLALSKVKIYMYMSIYVQYILWRIDPSLSGESVNNSRCYAIGE